MGGSFYIQSKIFQAKEFLIKDFPGSEELYRKQNKLDEAEADSKKEETKNESAENSNSNKEQE